MAGEWNNWILFRNGGDFGIEDEQFSTDIGFYVFKLPFLNFVVGWLFAAVLIVLIVTTVAHYLNGGIRIAAQGGNRVAPAVKGHLSVLLALIALVKAAGYWLDRYELTLSSRGVVDGASFTDVNAQLPAINLLLLISSPASSSSSSTSGDAVGCCPVLGVGLWALVAIVAGGIYPQFVQRVQVQPNEPAREGPFMERNIEATREALGLDIETAGYDLNTDKDSIDLRASAAVGAEHPHLGPVARDPRSDLPAAAAGPQLLPHERRRH